MYGIEIVIEDITFGNGATNIYKIVKGYIRNKERSDYLLNITSGLCRSNLSVVLDNTT